ncbi:hypothetical protein HELRODRAFT_112427 [Helobdella robusta]|uniref:RBR-type E3 ubiquitin transferase n=1 Tax=Helobdella robusta TaxID=6412 RepID=T1EFJ8_HELRO|nr:hypothetical protein HELRODRAFT_112427 [Helobdella robusta]ESO03109.1 hypothetical protein HELRODRAFT_112427 [Helobdella robusta]
MMNQQLLKVQAKSSSISATTSQPQPTTTTTSSSSHSSSSKVKCKLCWDHVPFNKMHTLNSCKCIFCHQCLKEYLTVCIQEGNVYTIECPDRDCKEHGIILQDEVANLIGSDLYKKYKQLRYHKDIDFNPNRSFCPMKNCDMVCVLDKEDFSKQEKFTSRPIWCPKCDFVFCILCKETWHPGCSCVENIKVLQKKAMFDGIRYDDSENATIKRCPFCFLPIERDGGCAQIKCKKCNHIFCWFCLTCLDSDALFLHYERGSCKNKLGHSRASIILHRFQVVVTIFTGIGLLMLMASPVILIAAPCIVCCKIKSIRQKKHSQQLNSKRNNMADIIAGFNDVLSEGVPHDLDGGSEGEVVEKLISSNSLSNGGGDHRDVGESKVIGEVIMGDDHVEIEANEVASAADAAAAAVVNDSFVETITHDPI